MFELLQHQTAESACFKGWLWKTGLKANNIEIKRIAGFILHRDGIFSLNENEVIDFIKEETDDNFYIEEKAKYMSSEKLSSILNLNINLQ